MDIAELYARYFGALAGYAARLTGSRASGEDIAQEAFMRAMGSIETFIVLNEGQQKSWLYTAARRIVIDRKRRIDRAPPAEEEPVWTDDLTRLEVAQLLGQLEEDKARIVQLRFFAGMNSTEIGRLMGMPPATVRTRLRSAVNKLRKLMEE